MFTHQIIFDKFDKIYSCKLIPTQKLYNRLSIKDGLERIEKIIINQQLEKYLSITFYKYEKEIIMRMYIQNKIRTDLKNEIINYIKSNNFGNLIKTDIDYMYGQTIYRFNIINPEILFQLM